MIGLDADGDLSSKDDVNKIQKAHRGKGFYNGQDKERS
jgi:hypothetical protein